jgi:glutamate/aspartate transport system substrate-binding protein
MPGLRPWRGLAALAAAAAVLLLAAPAPAPAQEAAGVEVLTGTLRRIRESGTITLGFREGSVPFSFRDARGEPIGYSVDLCRAIAEDAAAELGLARLALAWRAVTPETRIAAVAEGEVDLECGSTTGTAGRRRQVGFSPVIYVAGTRLLVPRDSPVRSLRDLAGRRVVVTAGTTNEAVLRELAERQRLDIRLLTRPEHAQSYAALVAGEAEALASDDVLLFGWIAATPGGDGYRVTGETLSQEPYGLMLRRDDPAFAALVERSFARLAQERRLSELYRRWFLRRLPNGQRMDLPMSAELREVFRMLGEPD